MARRAFRADGPASWFPSTQQHSTNWAASSEESTDDAAETARRGHLPWSRLPQTSKFCRNLEEYRAARGDQAVRDLVESGNVETSRNRHNLETLQGEALDWRAAVSARKAPRPGYLLPNNREPPGQRRVRRALAMPPERRGGDTPRDSVAPNSDVSSKSRNLEQYRAAWGDETVRDLVKSGIAETSRNRQNLETLQREALGWRAAVSARRAPASWSHSTRQETGRPGSDQRGDIRRWRRNGAARTNLPAVGCPQL